MSNENFLERPETDDNLLKRFKSDDGFLVIEVELETPYIHFIVGGGRVHFNSKLYLLKIVSYEDELIMIEFENDASMPVKLKNLDEAHQIAEFLGVALFEWCEDGEELRQIISGPVNKEQLIVAIAELELNEPTGDKIELYKNALGKWDDCVPVVRWALIYRSKPSHWID